jgi:hypothetical protein
MREPRAGKLVVQLHQWNIEKCRNALNVSSDEAASSRITATVARKADVAEIEPGAA